MKEKNAVLLWMWKAAGADRRPMYAIALLEMILSGAAVASAWLLRGLIDGAATQNASAFLRYAALYGGLTVAQLFFRALYRYITARANVALKNAFQRRLFDTLLHKDYAAVTATHTGQWLTRLTSDVETAAGNLLSIAPQLIGLMVRFLGALWLVLQLIPQAICVIVPCGVLMVGVSLALRKTLKRLHKKIQEAKGEAISFFTEHLGGLMVLRAFGKEEQTLHNADDCLDSYKAAVVRHSNLSNFSNVCLGIGIQSAYFLTVLYCGSRILHGSMSYGTFLAVYQLVGQIQSPLISVSGFLPRYYAMVASAERLKEVEDYLDDGGKSIDPKALASFYQEKLTRFGFRRLCFTYPGVDGKNPVVLRDFDLDIQKGEHVAFTGPSGCGKSTILRLLLGLYTPDAGNGYFLCGGQEQPLTAACRGLFAYVPQGNQLMSGTIRQVVTFGDENVDEEMLHRALRISCSEAFVNALEKGADTPLGERGAGLSEGQMQRIAIARAIYSQRPILLLDEATSALDEETERQFLQNLRSMTDKTVIIITHRPAALEICDKIISFKGEADQ